MQTTSLHKVRAHTNINGNEQVDMLAKRGCKLDHRDHMNKIPTLHTMLPRKRLVALNARDTRQRPHWTP